MMFRILTAAVMLPLFLSFMFWEQAQWFRLFISFGILGAWYEYYRMASHGRGLKPSKGLGMSFVSLYLYSVVLDAGFGSQDFALSREALVVFFFFAVALRHILDSDERHGFERFLVEFGGGIYIGVLGSYLLRLHFLEEGARWFLLVFFIAWVYDSGAYFTGKSIGKTKFSQWSPNKTWEGFIGGLIAATVLTAWLAPVLLKVPGLDPLKAGALGLVGGMLAQLGDLFESMVKRTAGVKDSGSLILGHGGVLDKLDSSLYAAPLVYYAAMFWAGL